MAGDITTGAGGDGFNDRAVLVALELMRRTIADLPIGIARRVSEIPPDRQGEFARPQGPQAPAFQTVNSFTAPQQQQQQQASPRAGTRNPATDALDLLGRRFAMVAGGFAILNQTMQASTSGFSVLGTAVRVLSTTLAPILLPVVVALAAGFIALADKLEPLIQEALPRWTAFIFDRLIPAFEFLADVVVGTVEVFGMIGDAIGDAVGAIGDFVSWVGEKLDAESDTGKGLTGAMAMIMGRGEEGVKAFGGIGDETGKEGFGNPFEKILAAARERMERDPTGTGAGDFADDAEGGKGKGGGTRSAALMDVLKSLRLSMGPRAQVSGLADVGRSLQMAALNTDPLEARMLRTMEKSLSVMERTAVGVEKLSAPKPDFAAGDFAGDF